jgi:hypothetical protein
VIDNSEGLPGDILRRIKERGVTLRRVIKPTTNPARRIGTRFAAGMIEAGKQFRRVNGHLHLPTLRAALERQPAESVGPVVHDDQVNAA